MCKGLVEPVVVEPVGMPPYGGLKGIVQVDEHLRLLRMAQRNSEERKTKEWI